MEIQKQSGSQVRLLHRDGGSQYASRPRGSGTPGRKFRLLDRVVESDRPWATVVESTSPARETFTVSKAVCLGEKRKMQEGKKGWTLGWDSYSQF